MDIIDHDLSTYEDIVKIIEYRTCSMPDCNISKIHFFAFEETIYTQNNDRQLSFWLYCKNHFPYHYSNESIMRGL